MTRRPHDLHRVARRGVGEKSAWLATFNVGDQCLICHGGELRGRAGLRVRADPLEAARRLVMTLPGIEHVTIVGDSLRIATDPGEAPAINRALVEAGIAVSELYREQTSLEEVFLELTQEGTDAT